MREPYEAIPVDRESYDRVKAALATEQEMHLAWRKRAEEAEAEIDRLRDELTRRQQAAAAVCDKIERALRIIDGG